MLLLLLKIRNVSINRNAGWVRKDKSFFHNTSRLGQHIQSRSITVDGMVALFTFDAFRRHKIPRMGARSHLKCTTTSCTHRNSSLLTAHSLYFELPRKVSRPAKTSRNWKVQPTMGSHAWAHSWCATLPLAGGPSKLLGPARNGGL